MPWFTDEERAEKIGRTIRWEGHVLKLTEASYRSHLGASRRPDRKSIEERVLSALKASEIRFHIGGRERLGVTRELVESGEEYPVLNRRDEEEMPIYDIVTKEVFPRRFDPRLQQQQQQPALYPGDPQQQQQPALGAGYPQQPQQPAPYTYNPQQQQQQQQPALYPGDPQQQQPPQHTGFPPQQLMPGFDTDYPEQQQQPAPYPGLSQQQPALYPGDPQQQQPPPVYGTGPAQATLDLDTILMLLMLVSADTGQAPVSSDLGFFQPMPGLDTGDFLQQPQQPVPGFDMGDFQQQPQQPVPSGFDMGDFQQQPQQPVPGFDMGDFQQQPQQPVPSFDMGDFLQQQQPMPGLDTGDFQQQQKQQQQPDSGSEETGPELNTNQWLGDHWLGPCIDLGDMTPDSQDEAFLSGSS